MSVGEYFNQSITVDMEELRQLLEAKEKETTELKAWKESAMSVMSPMQEIGKALGVKLG